VARAFAGTVALVASSFTLVAAERAGARPGGGRRMRRWLLVTMALGLAFLVNQLLEYASLDFGADSHPYGSIYYAITGLHGLHVAAGVAAIGLLFVRTVRSRAHRDIAAWEGGVSLFWHLVDVIWVLLFSTIWLLQ
jgi:cytochrome c oxidase subunit 3